MKTLTFLVLLVLLAAMPLPAPPITGAFFEITQSVLDQTIADGPLHFRNCPVERNKIISQLSQFGSPWIGWAISGSASSPCLVLHRTEFPHQGQGNPEVRTEGVKNAVNALAQSVVEVEGATDDFGNPIEAVHYHVQIHFFQHRTDNQQVIGGTYLPEIDYNIMASDNPITGQWWIQN